MLERKENKITHEVLAVAVVTQHVVGAAQRSGWKGGRLTADLGFRRGGVSFPILWLDRREQSCLWGSREGRDDGGFRPGGPCPALCPSPLAAEHLNREGPAELR